LKKIIAIISLAILMSGCASIVSESAYPVSFTSDPNGSKIIITDSMGIEIYSGRTPSVVELEGKDGFFSGASYKILISKEGYEDKIIVIHSKLDGWYWGNILFGGLIGMLIVDPATGSMWTLPKASNATLTKSTAMNTNQRELRFVSLDKVPEEYLDKLIEIN